MPPPPRKGGIESSSSARAPEHADAGRSEELVAREGVEVAAERAARRRAGAAPPARRRRAAGTPRARHSAAISRDRDSTVPSTFETCATRHEPRARREQRLERVEQQHAAVVDRRDAQRCAARARRASATARCSSGAPSRVTTISSPGSRCVSPKLCATRLIASVVLRTNTISRAVARAEEARDLRARLVERARRRAARARSTPRCTLA